MIEVFKTNVGNSDDAAVVLALIQQTFPGYQANFDLTDCDNILRILAENGSIRVSSLINLLNDFGFIAEVLTDDVPVISQLRKYALSRKVMMY